MFRLAFQYLSLMGTVVLFVLTGNIWTLLLFPVMVVAFMKGWA